MQHLVVEHFAWSAVKRVTLIRSDDIKTSELGLVKTMAAKRKTTKKKTTTKKTKAKKKK